MASIKKIRLIQDEIDKKLRQLNEVVDLGFYPEQYGQFCRTISKLTSQVEDMVQDMVVESSKLTQKES